MKKVILLDNGHGKNTVGKHSPDKRLYEWSWNREVAKMIHKELKSQGYDVRLVVEEDIDISLKERVRRVNAVCAQYGASNVVLVSVHINAASNDNKWHDARGFSVWVSKKAGENSKKLANFLYDNAEKRGLKGNRWVPKERYWTANYTIITSTSCPAVLTENMFQDNKEDCEWLLSEEGKKTIVDLHVEALKEYLK